MIFNTAYKWFLAGLFYLLSSCVHADIMSASIDYHSGEYQKAYEAFNRLAKLGNKDAIYNIAVMYLHGQGREENLNQAYAWFKVAADFGLADASLAAKMIEAKSDNKQALLEAYQGLQQDLSLQHFEQTLAPEFVDVNYHFELEATYPAGALKQGLEGWVWLEFDVDESGVVTDIDIIESYPDKSFNRSVLNALKRKQFDGSHGTFTLVKHFTTYKGKRYQASFSRQKQQYQAQVNDLIERAEQGNAAVQYHIANFMMGFDHNATRLLRYHWSADKAGSELLLEAATNGYASAQYRLGSYLLEGIHSQKDRLKGINWISKAAKQGFRQAEFRLGVELLAQQPDIGVRWLEKAASKRHFRAMRDLVYFYVEHERWQQAQTWLDKGMIIDDEHPALWQAKSRIYAGASEQYNLASEARQKAVEFAKSRGWYLP